MKRNENQREIIYCVRQYLALVKVISALARLKGSEKNKARVCLMQARDVYKDRINEIGPHKGMAANVLWALVGDASTFPNRKALEGYLLPLQKKGPGRRQETRWALYRLAQPRLQNHLKKGINYGEARRLFNRAKKQVIGDYYSLWKTEKKP